MNKSELIDAIAEKGGVSKTDAGKALDATIASITEGSAKTASLYPFSVPVLEPPKIDKTLFLKVASSSAGLPPPKEEVLVTLLTPEIEVL